MERGRSPDYWRDPYIEATEFYRQVLEELGLEFERDPALREEFRGFVDYIVLMQSLIPTTLSDIEQQHRFRTLNHELERTAFPPLPVTLPPPHQRIAVGQHMDVTVGYTAEACWPNKSDRELQLSDATIVKPPTPIGKIDIARNLPRLDPDANPLGFARTLLSSSIQSLRELAILCEDFDLHFSRINTFAGVSHLARLSGRLGFTVFDIANPFQREQATQESRQVAEYVAGDNTAWQQLRENYKPAKIAFISRQHLEDKFGSRATGRNFV